jgi:hypothetical protein
MEGFIFEAPILSHLAGVAQDHVFDFRLALAPSSSSIEPVRVSGSESMLLFYAFKPIPGFLYLSREQPSHLRRIHEP